VTQPTVSVVVATYNPGNGLDRLVRSLEAQTLPAWCFEVILVDDGSTSETWTQLQAVRSSHCNVRIERIPHSGWPSRPRNVGISLAEGEFLLFADHDDELFPRACAPPLTSPTATSWTSRA
jgi:glycosyltransferase involved in cell wall biosynthesis